MVGGIDVDELEKMSKTHPRSALNLAYGQGIIVGINRAKLKFKDAATAEANKRMAELESEVAELKVQIEGLIESGSAAMTSLKASNNDLREKLETALTSLRKYENGI